jgi:hypothetical protein
LVPYLEVPMSATRPAAVIVPEGYVVHISEQTASRSYDAVVVPGEYEIEYVDVNYHPVPNASHREPYYALIRMQVISPRRSQPGAIFGGVTYSMETVEESRHERAVTIYAYELEGKTFVRGGLELVF